MKINLNGEDYIVTDMIVVDGIPDTHMRYNVFDSKYNFVTSISCEDEVEFMLLFNNYLKEHSYDMV